MENRERFSIQVRDDGVFLIVLPAVTGELPLEIGTVLDFLAVEKIAEYNRMAVEGAIRAMSGVPEKIAEPQKKPPVAEISVLVSRDRMEAFLQIDMLPGAVLPETEVVLERLAKAGVTSGILSDAVGMAMRQPNLRVLCARGKIPENGSDAKVEYRVDLANRGKPVENAEGGVDFKNIGLYINVEKGQVLAVKTPATTGVAGTDVCGNNIPARAGKDILLHPGSNVQIIDGTQMVSVTGGNLMIIGGKMSVSPILSIKGDVDLSTGNIDFAGDVVIQGSVQEGFFVKAGGNVEIAGMICGGNVQGYNVTVRQGILGLNRGVITAFGSVSAKFIENAKVSAEQDIIVTDVVLHSQLSAAKKVKVEGRRGQIVGGITTAGDEIIVKSGGSASAIPTELQAGVNPKLRDAYLTTRKELKTAETSLDQLQKGLFTLRAIDQSQLSPEKKDLLLKITRAQFTTMGQVDSLQKKMAELEIAYDELRDGQIKISDYVFPGVKIVIGPLVKPLQEEYRFVVFYADAGEIKFRPLK